MTVTQFIESDTGYRVVTYVTVTVTVTQSCDIKKNIKSSGIDDII